MKNPLLGSIGLVSDTHFQDRSFSLPPVLASYFEGVDLILHAGDVGELDVLDFLGRIAPTIAIHGNDEPEPAMRDLPEQQLVALFGVRILLWHSHYPDPAEEKNNRKGPWRPRIERLANHAKASNARVVVYGHTHVPMAQSEAGILIVNPGALAASSYFTRQSPRTVAKLTIALDGSITTTHFDVDANHEITLGALNLDEDFGRLAARYQAQIVEPDLIAAMGALRKIVFDDQKAAVRALFPLYRRAMQDGGNIRLDELIQATKVSNLITQNDKDKIIGAIEKQ